MSTAAKVVTVTVTTLFLVIGAVWGAVNELDWRYFTRVEAQALDSTVQQQRVDALYRDLDNLKLRERRRKLSDFERAHLQRIEREIERQKKREKK